MANFRFDSWDISYIPPPPPNFASAILIVVIGWNILKVYKHDQLDSEDILKNVTRKAKISSKGGQGDQIWLKSIQMIINLKVVPSSKSTF